jgi:hypothetical protein
MSPHEELTLPGRAKVKVYRTDEGYICLEQEEDDLPNNSVIYLLPSDIPMITKWLEKLTKELPGM